MTVVLKILQFVLLILCVGFFTSSETAYLSLNQLKVRRMIDEKRKNARLVEKLKGNMDKLLTTVLIGTNFLTSFTSALVTALVLMVLGDSRLNNLVPFITAFFITTFGQIVPKTVAGIYPEKIASFSSQPLRLLEIIFFPVIWIFQKLSSSVVKLAEKIMKNPDPIITEEELKTLIALGEKEGTIERGESRMMNRLIKFNDLCVHDIMKHKNFVRMLNYDDDFEQMVSRFDKYGYSIMPVYKENQDNIVGIVDYKTVLYAENTVTAGKIMQEVNYVPGTFSVLEMLNRFRQEEYRFAVVLNEQGQTSGIITMEDIIRMVFGRMTVEENLYNQVAPEEKIKIISQNTILMPGEMKIEEANEILGLDLFSEHFMTIGGWILEQFGHLPSTGEIIIHEKTIFQIEEILQHRIVTVRVIKNQQ